jgi:hypothetical protein
MEIERFARNLQTTPTPVPTTAPKSSAPAMGSAASLLMQHAQQVRGTPAILRNSPSSKSATSAAKPNTTLGQLLTNQRTTTTQPKSTRQTLPVAQQAGNGTVVYRNLQQQRGAVPAPPPLVAMPTLASNSVLSKALQSSLPMPAPLPPPPPSVVVTDVIELSDDEDDSKNSSRVNGDQENQRDSENGDQTSDEGGARKKRRLEGLLTGTLTEEEVLAEIRETAAQRATNGRSLFMLEITGDGHNSLQNKTVDKVKKPSNTARKGMSSRPTNGCCGRQWCTQEQR